jgi:hypothetical protein
VARIMSLPEIGEQLAKQGFVHRPNTPEDFERMVRAQVDELGKVIKLAAIKIQ